MDIFSNASSKIINNMENNEKIPSYVLVRDNKYITYKVSIDKDGLKKVCKNITDEYSDVETIIENKALLEPVMKYKPRETGNIEVLDYVIANSYRPYNDYNDSRVGGPVYADVVADIKRHPALEKIINKIISSKDFDLLLIYKYILKVLNMKNTLIKSGEIVKLSFDDTIVLSNKEKELSKDDLRIILNSILDYILLEEVKQKEMHNDEIIIDTSIDITELKLLKESLKIAKINADIATSEAFKEVFNEDVNKKLVKKNRISKPIL